MQLSIPDNRPNFWQWDTQQQLLVEHPTCNEVHFTSTHGSEVFTVTVKESLNGQRVADVPNILLQTPGTIIAFLYHSNPDSSHTEFEYHFPVTERPQPSNYVYTETEILNYSTIEKRVTVIEQKINDGNLDSGADIQTATVEIIQAFPLSSDADPTVTEQADSTALHRKYTLGIPSGLSGVDGITPNLTIGTISSLDEGSNADASITGTKENPVLHLCIPRGYTGAKGDPGDHGESAHEIALRNGFVGDEKAWLASLHAANPIVLNKGQYPSEAEAIAYMDAQGDNAAVYVWNNKLFAYASMEVQSKGGGACLYGYRNSASSGLKVESGKSTFIIPVSDFTAPITIDFTATGLALSSTPYIYGGTSATAFPTTLISDDNYVGRTDPVTISDLQSCTYVAFAVTTSSQPSDLEITVNDTAMVLKVITTTDEIESALSGGGSTTVNGFADSGVEYAAIVGQDNSTEYLESRNTYVMPVPCGYCESHVSYDATATHYLTKYDFDTMTGLFSALAADYPDYVTETLLGQDATGTYDIKQYVLDAPSTLSSGYTSAMSRDKPVFIITSGLHGVEPDAVHTVYHFMKDLCENHMENEQLEYLKNNVKFVIVPLSNPWGYVNQSYYNSNGVDLNKNFECGYQNNGTDYTGSAAYSEAETVLLKGVFDSYSDAVFHLECHGKYGVDTSYAQTIWFSLMQSLSSELIELCADTITKQIGRRLYKLGYATNKSVGGYITYYGLNGRPKDYTGTKYGILSATMEGTGCIYGETEYSVNTQKINCEALENFVLRIMDALNSNIQLLS